MDDCISRQAVIDTLYNIWGDSGELLDAIKELPCATPARPKGEWLQVDEKADAFDCSNCDAMVKRKYNYCPKCGSYNGGDAGADRD